MQILIFIVLIIVYLVVGVKFVKNKNILAFFLLTVTLPITPSLSPLHTYFQLNVYYFFVFVVVFVFFVQSLFKSKIDKNLALTTLLTISFISFYLVYDLILYKENLDPINVFKDIKPLLFLLFGFIFINIMKDKQLDWNGEVAKKIIKYNFIASILWFVILNSTGLIAFVTSDPFYTVTETRYTSIGFMFVLLYFIAGLANSIKFRKLDVLYILVPLFLTGNRTVLFLLALLFLVNMVMVTKNVMKLVSRVGAFLITTFVLMFGVFSFNEKLRTRILTMFDYDIVIEQLISFRFAPFIDKITTYNWYDYIFGKGIGETIFIPWFVWRETIDDYNIYMDNIYLTLYIKYGVFSLIIIMVLVCFLNQTSTNKRFKILMLIYFFVIGLTTAFMYQSIFLFVLITLASFGFAKDKINAVKE